jgi:acyl carrier protein
LLFWILRRLIFAKGDVSNISAAGRSLSSPFSGRFRSSGKSRLCGEQWFTNERERSRAGRVISYLRSMMGSRNLMRRQSMSVRLRIIAAMRQIAEEQKVTLPPLDDELSLHETGFDSLGFAILVARLEDDLGVDPFTISEDATFPLTVGDFIRAYENVPA